MSTVLPDGVSVNVFKLIKEIKARPCLYDKRVKEYTNILYRKKMWDEVLANVVPNHYASWNKVQKHRALLALQKRWGNLRTTFVRALKSNKQESKYRYQDHMMFLLGSGIPEDKISIENIKKHDYETDEAQSESGESQNDSEEKIEYLEEEITDETTIEQQEETDEEFETTTITYSNEVTPTKVREERIVYDEDYVDPMTYQKSGPDTNSILDQDVNFCMSLAPMLKNLPQNKKIKVQIEILKIFDRVNDGKF